MKKACQWAFLLIMYCMETEQSIRRAVLHRRCAMISTAPPGQRMASLFAKHPCWMIKSPAAELQYSIPFRPTLSGRGRILQQFHSQWWLVHPSLYPSIPTRRAVVLHCCRTAPRLGSLELHSQPMVERHIPLRHCFLNPRSSASRRKEMYACAASGSWRRRPGPTEFCGYRKFPSGKKRGHKVLS